MKINWSSIRLAVFAVLALTAVFFIWHLEQRRILREEQQRKLDDPIFRLIELKEKARGPSPPHEYLKDWTVRITDLAIARKSDGAWVVLDRNSLMRVLDTRVENSDAWVQLDFAPNAPAPTFALGTMRIGETVEVHSTFLERWDPVNIRGRLEISGFRLWSDRIMGMRRYAVRGSLRNIGGGIARNCVVTASFLNKDGKVVAESKTEPFTLRQQQIIQFMTPSVAEKFETVSLQVSWLDAENLVQRSEPIPLSAAP